MARERALEAKSDAIAGGLAITKKQRPETVGAGMEVDLTAS